MKNKKQKQTSGSNEYHFTHLTHQQMIDEIEVIRILSGLSITEYSKNAGYSKYYYYELRRNKSRFSEKSYNRFMDTGLLPEKSELDRAIEICKKAGLKISKCEITKTWIDL